MRMDETGQESREGTNWSIYLAIGAFVLVCAGLIYLAIQSDPGPQGPTIEMYGPWRFEWEPPFWKTLYVREGRTFDIRFRYLPQEVDDITVAGTQARLVAPFYLSFDPDMSNLTKAHLRVAVGDATVKLRGIYGETARAACTRNDTDPACLDVPTVTCETPNVSAIIFLEAEEPQVTLNGTCIIVEGTGADLYRAETLMWYRLLGIVR